MCARTGNKHKYGISGSYHGGPWPWHEHHSGLLQITFVKVESNLKFWKPSPEKVPRFRDLIHSLQGSPWEDWPFMRLKGPWVRYNHFPTLLRSANASLAVLYLSDVLIPPPCLDTFLLSSWLPSSSFKWGVRGKACLRQTPDRHLQYLEDGFKLWFSNLAIIWAPAATAWMAWFLLLQAKTIY